MLWTLLRSPEINYSILFRNACKLKFKAKLRPFQYLKYQRVEKNTITLVPKLKLLLLGGGALKICISNKIALCKKKQHSRIDIFNIAKPGNTKFDWKQFWSYVLPHIGYLLAAVMGALIVAILNIQIPQVMGQVINVLAKFRNNESNDQFFLQMKSPTIKLIFLYITQSFFTFFYIFMLTNLGEKVAYRMKSDLFHSILKQDIAFFDKQRTGEIVNRLTADIQDFKSSFKQVISGGLRASTQIIGCSISLFMISPVMMGATLLCIPSVIGIGTLFGSVLRVISRKAQAQTEKTTAVADEAISNIRTVRSFAMEDQEGQMYESEAAKATVFNEALGFGIGLFQAGTNLFLNGTVLMTLYMGGYLLSTDRLSAGDVMSFLMAAQIIQRSLSQISLLFGSLIKGVAAGGRIFEYINLTPMLNLKGGETIPDSSLVGRINFKNVTFAYPTRKEQMILEDFNLTIPAGKTVAIVGASGNGKSTIVMLLERFYDVDKGSVSIDGYDIRTLDPSWLRKRVLGFISQEPILFGTTIMENIRYGMPEATNDEVAEASKLANADEFISAFPKGYDTYVGEKGATLSGGQKQRIAIARALLKKPKVLLLDEATSENIYSSALDTESEKIVQIALEKAREGRTVIIIAHRLSTIRNADLILVLNKGKIVEMGKHQELLKLKGHYWALTYQQGREAEAG